MHLSKEARNSIGTMVTLKEIKDALWSMKPYKVPGPNGLYVGFFQRFWLVVGDSVVEEVRSLY